MNIFSEDNIKQNCPHCDPHSFALKYPLEETDNFWIVCDVHPLVRGHVLIIPKKHLSCIAQYPKDLFAEFVNLYERISDFIEKTYGSISTFEHGKIGQTVFHSHIQMLPFCGEVGDIVPEGSRYLTPIGGLNDLINIYAQDQSYLFFSIGKDKWVVNRVLGVPGFFRNRFAKALGSPLRGDWKTMSQNIKLMQEAEQDIADLRGKWNI